MGPLTEWLKIMKRGYETRLELLNQRLDRSISVLQSSRKKIMLDLGVIEVKE